MYQYVATLKSSQEVLAQAHSLQDLEKEITRYVHNNKESQIRDIVVIHHIKSDRNTGHPSKKLIKEFPI